MNENWKRRDDARRSPMRAIALLFFACAAVGCTNSGPILYPVAGTVTYNGKPVESGYITFTSTEIGARPTSVPITEGKYATKLTAGPHKVEVEASRFVGPTNKVMGLRPREQYIPDKYNLRTTLSADISADKENEFAFSLEGKE